MYGANFIRRNRFWIILPICALMLLHCDFKKEKPAPQPRIPYPDEASSGFIQEKVDSLKFLWFKEIKATVSAFCNSELKPKEPVSTADIKILSEALFHAKAEARLPDKILILTLERPFKHRGRDSIWQVTKMEVKSGE
jgi:hypothetical protein